jgi:hypothetical protein
MLLLTRTSAAIILVCAVDIQFGIYPAKLYEVVWDNGRIEETRMLRP